MADRAGGVMDVGGLVPVATRAFAARHALTVCAARVGAPLDRVVTLSAWRGRCRSCGVDAEAGRELRQLVRG
ncbi:MAG: hypothetical protein ACRD0V_08420 [Acidimicrobiales bacterium]